MEIWLPLDSRYSDIDSSSTFTVTLSNEGTIKMGVLVWNGYTNVIFKTVTLTNISFEAYDRYTNRIKLTASYTGGSFGIGYPAIGSIYVEGAEGQTYSAPYFTITKS